MKALGKVTEAFVRDSVLKQIELGKKQGRP